MEGNNSEMIEEEGLLYKLLDVSKEASDEEIRKSFKTLARRHHPDKNQDDPEAKSKFQKLNQAYQILSDPRKRKIYDTTGEIDGDGVKDISKFIDAYIYYREKYREITPNDIIEYKKNYVGGEDEEEDLIDFFERNEGDMTLILEAIPYSSNKDKERFINFFEKKLQEGELSEEFSQTFHETKEEIQDYIEEEMEEEEAEEAMRELQNRIQGNMRRRGEGNGGFLMIEHGGNINDLRSKILNNSRMRHQGFIQDLEERYRGVGEDDDEDWEEQVVEKKVSKKGAKKRQGKRGRRKTKNGN